MKYSSSSTLIVLGLISFSHAFSTLAPRRSSSLMMSMNSIVVVSPPGGIGEVTAVKAASMGSQVKWFVVSSNKAKLSQSIQLSQDALLEIKAAGGSVELAGADAEALLSEADALQAVSTWCGAADGMVTCLDGSDSVVTDGEEKLNPLTVWQNAIKVAAKEAAKGVKGRKIAVLSADEEVDDEEEESKQGGGFFSGLIGGKDGLSIPKSLSSAIKADTKLRHGQLFGIPESSPAFSALLGGPQKNPILCDEYQMRMVRIDPSMSVSGNAALGKEVRSCRHTVGEAAALIVNNKVNAADDVCLTSLRGMDKFDLWDEEFARVNEMLASGQGAQVFSTSFSSVPSIDRLTTWIATKWAPAVMRTYDIAAIRTGARPVSATKIDEGTVEILWQELKDFKSVTAGRLTLRITNDGMTATRGPGDAAFGYGSISRKPLSGENVLVRRLADAASQAMEKGLAMKPAPPKKVEAPKKPEPVVVSSLQSAATVPIPAQESAASGPRTSGARRSSERSRGGTKRTRRATSSSDDKANTSTTEEPGSFE